MSTRQLVLGHAHGASTTLTFSETSFTIHSESGWSIADTLRCRVFSESSDTEVPLRNVIAASVSGSTVEVTYLARTQKQRLCMQRIRSNVTENDAPLAVEWCASIIELAYQGGRPRKVLKVFINPHGGPGKARQIFTRQVEPILRAAGCTLDITVTTRSGHALDVVQHMDLKYDALVIVSGDGLIHEVLNGLAKHATPEEAFCIPVAPIPAGSGNGLSLNILGLHDGLDPCAAALNVLKGRPIKVDLFSFTQRNQKRISFMSQTVGLMADLDRETEHLRWMGDARFIWGFLRGVMLRKPCKMELSMKVVEQDKSEMVDALHARRRSAANGTPSTLPAPDVTSGDNKDADGTDSPEDWVKFEKPVLWMVCGKGPYASAALMQFPVSHHDDGLIDISVQEIVSRKFLLDAMKGAELGRSYWFSSNRYFKASAYRVKPLTTGGILMVDGEPYPLEEFRIDVLHRLGTLLSPYPHYAPDFNVIDVEGNMRET